MKSTKGHYLLSGELEHKEQVQLTPDISLQIAKKEVSNLRDRNPQIGRVEALMEGNPLGLEIGDRVVVHHFTFYRDIAAEKGYELQPHVLIDGKRLFKALQSKILFKMIDNIPCMIGNVLLVSKEVVADERFGMYFGEKTVVKITHGNKRLPAGTEVITELNALYLIEVDGKDYYKIFEDEVVATVVGDEIIPFDDTVVVKDMPVPQSVLVKINNPVFGYSQVIAVGENVNEVEVGDTVYGWPQQGQRIEGLRYITVNNIIGITEKAKAEEVYGD